MLSKQKLRANIKEHTTFLLLPVFLFISLNRFSTSCSVFGYISSRGLCLLQCKIALHLQFCSKPTTVMSLSRKQDPVTTAHLAVSCFTLELFLCHLEGCLHLIIKERLTKKANYITAQLRRTTLIYIPSCHKHKPRVHD